MRNPAGRLMLNHTDDYWIDNVRRAADVLEENGDGALHEARHRTLATFPGEAPEAVRSAFICAQNLLMIRDDVDFAGRFPFTDEERLAIIAVFRQAADARQAMLA